MSLFVINIGNTHTSGGVWENGALSDLATSPTQSLSAKFAPLDSPVAGACVVPDKKSLFNDRVLWVSPTLRTGLDTSTLDVSTIGEDRLANAVALAKFHQLPAVCVDCGTAITFDVVDEHRRYHGGVIAPGRTLVRKALKDYTAQLPDVPLVNELRKVIGTNTRQAMLSGTDHGLVHLVKGLIGCVKQEINSNSLHVILTGGDADFFAPHIPDAINGGSDLTLKGIAAIWEMNQ